MNYELTNGLLTFLNMLCQMVPDSFFTDLNLPSIVTMLIVLLIAVPMYVCSTGSIPIAAVVTGNPSDEIVKKTVEELGFEFKGRK